MIGHVKPMPWSGVGAVLGQQGLIEPGDVDLFRMPDANTSYAAAFWLYPFKSVLSVHPTLHDPEFFPDVLADPEKMVFPLLHVMKSHFFVQGRAADMDLFLGGQESFHEGGIPAYDPAHPDAGQAIRFG